MAKFPITDLQKIQKPKRVVNRVFLHCSASDNPKHDNAETIDAWHRARGWDKIGYHFFIRKDGTIQDGRELSRFPAAQKGHNVGSIAICVHGLLATKFTKEQRVTVNALCIVLNNLYSGTITFHGHCEVEPNKTCPVFDYREWLGLDKNGKMKR